MGLSRQQTRALQIGHVATAAVTKSAAPHIAAAIMNCNVLERLSLDLKYIAVEALPCLLRGAARASAIRAVTLAGAFTFTHCRMIAAWLATVPRRVAICLRPSSMEAAHCAVIVDSLERSAVGVFAVVPWPLVANDASADLRDRIDKHCAKSGTHVPCPPPAAGLRRHAAQQQPRASRCYSPPRFHSPTDLRAHAANKPARPAPAHQLCPQRSARSMLQPTHQSPRVPRPLRAAAPLAFEEQPIGAQVNQIRNIVQLVANEVGRIESESRSCRTELERHLAMNARVLEAVGAAKAQVDQLRRFASGNLG